MTKLEVEAFLSVVKMGSISAAAQALYVTQPALSRRIRSMEEELGYELFHRGKGIRNTKLTEEGKAFIAVAEKLLYVYREASSIGIRGQKKLLKITSVGSVSNYLLPEVLQAFLEEEQYNLEFSHTHSFEAYSQVESGMSDIALISDDMYSREVHTVPAFKEPFVFVGGEAFAEAKRIHPSLLKPEKEIRCPWNPEYDRWHEKWFDVSIYPKVNLDQMSLIEEFLVGDHWGMVPLSVAQGMKKRKYYILPMNEGPEDRIIYYIFKSDEKKELIARFLQMLHVQISKIDGICSFLGQEEKFSSSVSL